MKGSLVINTHICSFFLESVLPLLNTELEENAKLLPKPPKLLLAGISSLCDIRTSAKNCTTFDVFGQTFLTVSESGGFCHLELMNTGKKGQERYHFIRQNPEKING